MAGSKVSPTRKRESASMRWDEAQLRRMFARAEDLGHSISVIKVRQGSACLCACGWTTNPAKRTATVLVRASFHVGEVLGIGEPGQMVGPVPPEAPAAPAPATGDARRVAG